MSEHERARSGGDWVQAGLVLGLVTMVIVRVFMMIALEKLRAPSPGFNEHDRLFAQIRVASIAGLLVGLLADLAVVVGLVHLRRRAHGMARGALLVALLVFAWLCLEGVGYLAVNLSDLRSGSLGARLIVVLRWTYLFSTPLAIIALALGLDRQRRDEGAAPAPMLVGTAVIAALLAAVPTLLRDLQDPAEYSLTWSVLEIGGRAVALAALALLARRIADAERSSAGWQRGADGMNLFASALLWRVAIIIGGVVLMVLAFPSHSLTLVKAVTIGVPLAQLGCAMALAVAALRLRSLPDAPSVRAAGGSAAFCFAITFSLQGVVLMSAVDLVRDAPAFGAMHLDAATLLKVELAAGLFGLLGLLIVVDGLRRVAQLLARPDEASLALGLSVLLLVLFGAQIALQYRPWLERLVESPMKALAVLMFGAVAVLFVVLRTARLARTIAGEMRCGPKASLPAAQVR